jgi:hypothetical protein
MAIVARKLLAACVTLAAAYLAGCGSGAGVAILDTQYPRCVQNLLKIGMALHEHHDEVGSFPKAAISDGQGRPGLSWRVAIPHFSASGNYMRGSNSTNHGTARITCRC